MCAQLLRTLGNPKDYSPPGSSMRFSKQEYWNGLPFPPPEDLPNLRTEPTSLASPVLTTTPLLLQKKKKIIANHHLTMQAYHKPWICKKHSIGEVHAIKGRTINWAGMPIHSSWPVATGPGQHGRDVSQTKEKVMRSWLLFALLPPRTLESFTKALIQQPFVENCIHQVSVSDIRQPDSKK